MPKSYEVLREIKGPFGLSRQTRLGDINEGESVGISGGKGSVVLGLHNETLHIKSIGEPVRVEFGAQPQLGRPQTRKVLYGSENEVITGRSSVNITVIGQRGRQKLVLTAPEPQPLILTATQTVALVTDLIVREGRR